MGRNGVAERRLGVIYELSKAVQGDYSYVYAYAKPVLPVKPGDVLLPRPKMLRRQDREGERQPFKGAELAVLQSTVRATSQSKALRKVTCSPFAFISYCHAASSRSALEVASVRDISRWWAKEVIAFVLCAQTVDLVRQEAAH